MTEFLPLSLSYNGFLARRKTYLFAHYLENGILVLVRYVISDQSNVIYAVLNMYSSLPNNRAGWNKRAGWPFFELSALLFGWFK